MTSEDAKRKEVEGRNMNKISLLAVSPIERIFTCSLAFLYMIFLLNFENRML